MKPSDRNQALATRQHALFFLFKWIFYISQFFTMALRSAPNSSCLFTKLTHWAALPFTFVYGMYYNWLSNQPFFHTKKKESAFHKNLKTYIRSSVFCLVKRKWKENKFHLWYFPTSLSLPVPFTSLCPVSLYVSQLARGFEEPRTPFLFTPPEQSRHAVPKGCDRVRLTDSQWIIIPPNPCNLWH